VSEKPNRHDASQAVIDAARRVVVNARESDRADRPRFPGYLDQLEDALREYDRVVAATRDQDALD
jgi:hypothetical protein